MKKFNGKAIYQPSGKAAEYAKYACNFYVGCSNGCEYCYCKKGILAGAMGMNKPQLKKCFMDEAHALEVYKKELKQNLLELQKNGLFFSFSTDPMLPGTIELTEDAMGIAHWHEIPCKILTKCTQWVDEVIKDDKEFDDHRKDLIAYGFTLTGHDELEPNASTNTERIEAMRKLHNSGFKTFASIEPIIDFESSKDVIRKSAGYCDLYKIGLESGKKYDKIELLKFIEYCNSSYISDGRNGFYKQKNYFKDSILKQANINRSNLPKNCVTKDYNIFEQ